MGREKSLLVLSGQILWQRQWDLLQRHCQWVAASAPRRPKWMTEDVAWVPDAKCGQGPVRGILGALTWTRNQGARHLLVLAVDMPRVTAGLLSTILSAVRPSRGVIPSHGDLLEPLCACYPIEALTPLECLVAGGENKLQHLGAYLVDQGLLAVHPLAQSETLEVFNMNTPLDLDKLREHSP